MLDYILEVSFDSAATGLEDEIQGRLFTTASTGSSSVDVNGTTTLSAYFDSDEDRSAAAKELEGLDVELHAADRERVDWLDHYEQSLEPLVIGHSFIVAPDARLIPADSDRMSIIVPQEQAFGTGSHETTALCIEMLESIGLDARRGLDVGSGSGILAIAMLRLGAKAVIAFDNDVDAYGALRDNRIRNGIDPVTMPLFIGSVEAMRGGTFDVVTMNIIPEVILPLLGEVTARVAADGHLLLSGILNVRRNDVVTAASTHGLHLTDERSRGEWWAGSFQR